MSDALKGHPVKKETRDKLRAKLFNKPRLDNRGPLHPFWKGGITPLRTQIYHTFEYRQWLSDILKRDDFTCVLCGVRGGDLAADHYPKAFSQILQEYNIKSIPDAIACFELWNLNNGRTLCKPCHFKTDNYGGNTFKLLRKSR